MVPEKGKWFISQVEASRGFALKELWNVRRCVHIYASAVATMELRMVKEEKWWNDNRQFFCPLMWIAKQFHLLKIKPKPIFLKKNDNKIVSNGVHKYT